MNRIVVDTSIVLACLLNEPEKEKILELTEDCELIAPATLPWEIGNALSAAFKRKRFDSVKIAHHVIQEFSHIELTLVQPNLKEAVEICFRRSIYAYDAYMISCARHSKAPLLTLDRRLRIVAQEENIRTMEV